MQQRKSETDDSWVRKCCWSSGNVADVDDYDADLSDSAVDVYHAAANVGGCSNGGCCEVDIDAADADDSLCDDDVGGGVAGGDNAADLMSVMLFETVYMLLSMVVRPMLVMIMPYYSC
ncbi:hypothetical protein DPMN_114284 [Dreissena polymorpha]|uniref:Uncharacterized protein n=1 Tax=Dreissena polymorpha TaxID=45954 RepID=A0A9D4KJR7_DREPO|nr:hypothetical protein DPMN_114284 [Dreissena polymorpha]